MLILSKLIYRFNATPIKNPNIQRTKNKPKKTLLEKKKKKGGFTSPI